MQHHIWYCFTQSHIKTAHYGMPNLHNFCIIVQKKFGAIFGTSVGAKIESPKTPLFR